MENKSFRLVYLTGRSYPDKIQYQADVNLYVNGNVRLNYNIEYYFSSEYNIGPEIDISFPDPYINDPDGDLGLDECNKFFIDFCIGQLDMKYQEGDTPICYVNLKHEWTVDNFQSFIEDLVSVLNDELESMKEDL